MINQEEYEVLKALDSRAKSIVRQARGWLWVAEQPIMKDETGWYVEDGFDAVLEDDNLFHFIQWEDREPYNIAELIKEYEDKGDVGYTLKEFAEYLSKFNEKLLTESEEEMKKDKKWLKDEVARIYDTRDYWSVDDLRDEILDSINELDEPKKVVVPEEVYEYITQQKRDRYTIQQVFYQVHWNYKNESMAEEEEWVSGNEEEFAKAWLAYPNIEVEKEPLYYVVKDGVVILSKVDEYYKPHKSQWIGAVTNKEYIKENPDKVRFTEQEIKDYDERFWAFAVPVEEVEECYKEHTDSK